ncbi:MAG: ATP-dependent helicase [Candidatus Komeilibacteria bacterium]
MATVYKIKKTSTQGPATVKSGKAKVDYQMELNAEQLRVVLEAEGPCLVLAGAGSGKTRTIVYRVAYLLEQGITPQSILLLTFTNKAAWEMINRVESLLGNYPQGLWAGTFHHIANRLLRKYAKQIKYQNNFNILDSQDSRDLIRICVKDMNIDFGKKRFPSPAVLQNIISYHKNSQIALKEVIEVKHPQWIDLTTKIIDVVQAYEQRKLDSQVMDFDDLLLNLYFLLDKFPSIREKLATQFQYVLVDEYQDTNYLQAGIVKLLSSVHHNILVVGDDAQSIYSFRAADIGNILQFPKLFGKVKIFKMETNYRSTPEILNVANDIISYNREQYPKVLKSIQDAFIKPQLIPCATQKQEAEFISSLVLQLQDEGVPLRKMAVLFRATHHSQTLEMELNKKNIPYDYRGGLRFFERAHIKDTVAFLKLVNNVSDEISWFRVLQLQLGIGSVTAGNIVGLMKQRAAQDIKDVIQIEMKEVLSTKAYLGWENLINIFQVISNAKVDDVGKLIRTIAKSDYQNYLEAQYPDWQQRLQDLEQFALFAETYDDLTSFIAEVTLQEGFGVEKGKVDDVDEDRIVLSTVHQAKGLEWEVVFIINMVEAGFPNQKATIEPGGLEEERRLFYVAATRAEKKLFLTYPLVGGFDHSFNQMSPFILEIDQKKIERGRVEEDYYDDEMVIEIDENGERKSFLPDIDQL